MKEIVWLIEEEVADASAWLSEYPAAADTAPVSPVTWIGELLPLKLPFPSWPYVSSPHTQTVPSAFTEMLWNSPVATLVIPANPPTWIGV